MPSRYIPHSNTPPTDLKQVRHRINEALTDNVLRVHRHPSSTPNVYTGCAGEIIMDIRAFAVMPSKAFPSTPTSSLIAVPFHEPRHGNRVSFLETSVGPATLILVRQLRLRQNPDSTNHKHARRGKLDAELLDEVELAETWRSAIDVLTAAQDAATTEPINDDGCEVLYGRAGLLYALLLLQSELPLTISYLAHAGKPKDRVVKDIEKLCSGDNIKALVDDIIQRGVFGAQVYREELEESERSNAPPLMWSWHTSRYLGAAHGVVGILQILLHAPSEIIKPHWSKILGTVEWLLAIQDPLGNWPTKAGRHMTYVQGGAAMQEQSKRIGVDEEYENALVQWCHGATGFLILFSALLRRSTISPVSCALPNELRTSIIAATTRAAELVYTRGLLVKGTGLCHGVAGSVYALLAVSDALDTPESTPAPLRSHAHSLSRSLSHPHSISHSHAHDAEHEYWFLRAAHLADLAVGYRALEQEGKMDVPDRPYSLYEGVAGMCCAWAEVLLRLSPAKEGATNGKSNGNNGNGNGSTNGNPSAQGSRRGGMPGYDDLALLD